MTDYLIAVCKLCGHTVRISLEHGGRRAKCPKCDGIIEIPKGGTSIRLRSDRELTSEARAKAGRTGPDSDPDAPAARSAGKHTTARIRRVSKKPAPAPGRKIAMVATLIATLALVAGIAVVLLKKPAGETAPPAGPAPKAPAQKPPPTPPPAPVDPHAAVRSEVMIRINKFVEKFNTHDLNKMAEFYACDSVTLTRAFGALPVDTEVSYKKHEAKSMEFAENEVRVTLVVDRVVTNTETSSTETTEGVQRILTWTLKEKKWVISSPPEP